MASAAPSRVFAVCTQDMEPSLYTDATTARRYALIVSPVDIVHSLANTVTPTDDHAVPKLPDRYDDVIAWLLFLGPDQISQLWEAVSKKVAEEVRIVETTVA